MKKKKKVFCKKIDDGSVRFENNAKEEVVGLSSIKISHSHDLIEVYLVNEFKHNLILMNYAMLNLTYCSMLWNVASTMPQRVLPLLVIGTRILIF